MCGIAGVFGEDARRYQGTVDEMLHLMRSRGPDAESTSSDEWYILGHNRLAINDLTGEGEQPFTSSVGSTRCIYNGEIYNHRELRTSFGIYPRSSCDGAILPDLLGTRGYAALGYLRGMFALAWVDLQSRSMTLATDPFGMKPCYWMRYEGNVMFASEAGALTRVTDSRKLSSSAIASFLLTGCVPAQSSPYAAITRMEPGTWTRFEMGGTTTSGRILPVLGPVLKVSAAALVESFHESVAAHMLADVPVGLLLSDGVDSTAIAYSAAQTGRTPHCITVDLGGTGRSEAPAAAEVARELGTDHTIVRVDPSPDDLDNFFAAMDRPSIDGLNTYLACKAVAAQGVRVVLSGAGGDELLGGGYRHHRLGWAAWLSPPPLGRTGALLRSHTRLADRVPARAVSGLMSVGWPTDGQSLVAFARTLRHSRAMTERLISLDPDARHANFTVGSIGNGSQRSRMMQAETGQYLMSQLLPDSDSFAMAHSVELRVPFVDVRFASHAWSAGRSLQPKRKFAEAFDRPALVRAAAAEKQGFGVPMDSWMREGPLMRFVQACEHKASAMCDLLGADEVQRTVARWKNGGAHWSTVWCLASAEAWMSNAGAFR
jgi:asparagine synthase (glutamine-hydrolysing)